MFMPVVRRPSSTAFTLVEMIVVIAVIAVLFGLSKPAIQGIANSGGVDRTIASVSGTYEYARTYAMSNHTYVRVGIAQVPLQDSVTLPTIAIAVIAAADGSLANDGSAAMAAENTWRSVGSPLTFGNLRQYDTLNANSPNTSADLTPSQTNIASFSRNVGSLGAQNFTAIIQFNPAGEARVIKSESARYVKIGFDQPLQASATSPGSNKNPFLIRLSGISGSVSILRKEDLH